MSTSNSRLRRPILLHRKRAKPFRGERVPAYSGRMVRGKVKVVPAKLPPLPVG